MSPRRELSLDDLEVYHGWRERRERRRTAIVTWSLSALLGVALLIDRLDEPVWALAISVGIGVAAGRAVAAWRSNKREGHT